MSKEKSDNHVITLMCVNCQCNRLCLSPGLNQYLFKKNTHTQEYMFPLARIIQTTKTLAQKRETINYLLLHSRKVIVDIGKQ